MEEARRKLRIFLICVVMTAVLVGMIYYFTDVYGSEDVSEGTLVMNQIEDSCGIHQEKSILSEHWSEEQ